MLEKMEGGGGWSQNSLGKEEEEVKSECWGLGLALLLVMSLVARRQAVLATIAGSRGQRGNKRVSAGQNKY